MHDDRHHNATWDVRRLKQTPPRMISPFLLMRWVTVAAERQLFWRGYHYSSSYGKNTLNGKPPPPPPQESQSCLTPIPKACMCQSMSLGRSRMFQKTKEIKTCCEKSTFVRWRRHHSLQHVCRVVCLCGLQMWFAVEKQDVFSFSQPSPAGMCRQRCGWAGMYACPHVRLLCCLQGVPSYTMSLWRHTVKKKKNYPMCCFRDL